MANPTRIVIDRSFMIALTPSVAANLPTIRFKDPGLDAYGVPAGSSRYDVRAGDVITDPTIIATILAQQGNQQSGTVPNNFPFAWTAF